MIVEDGEDAGEEGHRGLCNWKVWRRRWRWVVCIFVILF